LSGRPYEPKNKIDGVDISALLTEPSPRTSPRRTFAFYTGIQDPKTPHTAKLNAIREDRWKYYLKPQRFRQVESDAEIEVPAGALFDLEQDPAELRDVALDHPDIVKRMKSLAERFIEELGDEDRAGSAVRKAAYFEGARPMNP
jgi:arylsulfatase A-like enzyme